MLPCPAAHIPWQGCNRAWLTVGAGSSAPAFLHLRQERGGQGPVTGSHGTPVLPPRPQVLAKPTVFTLEMFAEGLLRRPFAWC